MQPDFGPEPAPESPSVTRYFAPRNSCGGLIAAVGILFATGAGLLSTLPGSPVAAQYAAWLVWVLRLAPLPALVLLWAVASEAEFKVRTDRTAISFRHGLGQVTRVPWREVTDYFADCGRGVGEVCESGGSLMHEPQDEVPSVPLADYRPEFVLMSGRGEFVLDDVLSHLASLTAEVVTNAPPEAPRRWEEASWLHCQACGESFAVSLWPAHGSGGPAGTEAPACPYCAADLAPLLAPCQRPVIIQVRGLSRHRMLWQPPAPAVAPLEEAPEAFSQGEGEPNAAETGPELG